jgi:predicted permease
MINSLISLFLCISLGYICRRTKALNDEVTSGLSGLLINVTLPCTIFISLMREFSLNLLLGSLASFVASAAMYLFGLLIAIPIAKLLRATPSEKAVWQFALMFPNVGYTGFPVMNALYGADGLIYTSMSNVAFNFLVFTIGARIFTHGAPEAAGAKDGIRRVLVKPALIMTFIGFVFFIFSLRLPSPIEDGISLVSAMTTPLSMIVVGSLLAKSNLKSIFMGWKMYAIIFARLIMIPLATLLAIKPVSPDPILTAIVVLLAAMPVASLTVIFAEEYHGDSELASRMIFMSTLLMIATLPFIYMFL